MRATEDILDLAAIGKELDDARQSRTSIKQPDLVTVPESASESESESKSETESEVDLNTADTASSASHSPAASLSLPQADNMDGDVQSAPTCLLCFTRPPSAVLLPCCHLNLCYLCAPLLLLKQCRPSPSPASQGRIPFNVALSRAMANHPKSRRLSSGGTLPPEIGERGSELQACHLEESCGPIEVKSGLNGRRTEEGRIELSCKYDEGGARCLICRSGVSGWLRIYTG